MVWSTERLHGSYQISNFRFRNIVVFYEPLSIPF